MRKLIIIQANFTGKSSEPKEASKWQCGTIKKLFGTFHLSEIEIRQAKVISFCSFHTEKSLKFTEILISSIQSQRPNQFINKKGHILIVL